MEQDRGRGTYPAPLRLKLTAGEVDEERKMDYSRPQRIKEAAKTERRDEHKGNKLHHHGAERQDHEVVLQGDKSESAAGEGVANRQS